MLRVNDLACARGGLPVLQGVSFELGSGDVMLLHGPNGCGKTTLLRAITGLQPPTAGTVIADPESVAYCGHSNGIKPTLTVAENLGFWAAMHATDMMAPALEAFGISGLRDRPARNLSNGQKRRLGLARLLVTGRPVWALDEPTVSLDESGIELFTKAVRGHLNSGGAAIIATHHSLDLQAHRLDVASFRVNARHAAAFDGAIR